MSNTEYEYNVQPYMRDVLGAFASPQDVTEVFIKKGCSVGKTTSLINYRNVPKQNILGRAIKRALHN